MSNQRDVLEIQLKLSFNIYLRCSDNVCKLYYASINERERAIMDFELGGDRYEYAKNKWNEPRTYRPAFVVFGNELEDRLGETNEIYYFIFKNKQNT